MTIPIPPWFVATVGASLVVVSSFVGFYYVDVHLRNVQTLSERIAERENTLDRLWQQHLHANMIESHAESLASDLALTDPSIIDRFVMPRLAITMERAIMTMHLSYQEGPKLINDEQGIDLSQWDNPNLIDLEPQIRPEIESLSKGNLDSFDRLVSILSNERLSAAQNYEFLLDTVKELKRLKVKSQNDATTARTSQSVFNIVGLMIVLLKDLPIFRRKKS